MSARQETWTGLNQRYLVAALAQVRAHLENPSAPPPVVETVVLDPPPAIDALAQIFGLSQFERSVVLLCAGMELDSAFPALCGKAQGDATRSYPTFSLALAAFPAAHWSALSPAAPLRRWRLIELSGGPGAPLTASPLRIDERILHYLTGIQYLDDRLAALLDPVRSSEPLVPS